MATWVFRHQLIWDPVQREVAPLHDVRDDSPSGPMPFYRLLGAPMSAGAALALCSDASVDPVTLLSTIPSASRPPNRPVSHVVPSARPTGKPFAARYPPPPDAFTSCPSKVVVVGTPLKASVTSACKSASDGSANQDGSAHHAQPLAKPAERASRFFPTAALARPERMEEPSLPKKRQLETDSPLDATSPTPSRGGFIGRNHCGDWPSHHPGSRKQPKHHEGSVSDRPRETTNPWAPSRPIPTSVAPDATWLGQLKGDTAPRRRPFEVPRIRRPSPAFLDKFRMRAMSPWRA